MLNSHRKGYAVMSKDLISYSFEDESIETCKRYTRPGDVIVEQIPYVCGFTLTVRWAKVWYKPIYIKRNREKNIFHLHWSVSKVYTHKNGRIVFERN